MNPINVLYLAKYNLYFVLCVNDKTSTLYIKTHIHENSILNKIAVKL